METKSRFYDLQKTGKPVYDGTEPKNGQEIVTFTNKFGEKKIRAILNWKNGFLNSEPGVISTSMPRFLAAIISANFNFSTSTLPSSSNILNPTVSSNSLATSGLFSITSVIVSFNVSVVNLSIGVSPLMIFLISFSVYPASFNLSKILFCTSSGKLLNASGSIYILLTY